MKALDSIRSAPRRIASAPGRLVGKVRPARARVAAAPKRVLGKVRPAGARVAAAPKRLVGKGRSLPAPQLGGLTERIRTNPRVVIACAAASALLLAWIGWAIYATTEHGADAGLGVLISWPLVISAVALIISPFLLGGLLVRRRRSGATPAIAGGAEIDQHGDDEAMTGGTYPG